METIGQAGYSATGGALWTGSEEDVVFLCAVRDEVRLRPPALPLPELWSNWEDA